MTLLWLTHVSSPWELRILIGENMTALTETRGGAANTAPPDTVTWTAARQATA
jgi:hypothetical protein